MQVLRLAIEVSLPLLLGLLVSAYLRAASQRLLVQLCGTQEKSEFWVRTNSTLIVCLPLVLTLIFGRSGNPAVPVEELVRHALMMSTIGLLIAVGAIAKAVMDTIPKPAPHVVRPPEAAQ